jgi:hypothetical protein
MGARELAALANLIVGRCTVERSNPRSRASLGFHAAAKVEMVLGALSFAYMYVDIFPIIDLPVVMMIWTHPGLSAYRELSNRDQEPTPPADWNVVDMDACTAGQSMPARERSVRLPQIHHRQSRYRCRKDWKVYFNFIRSISTLNF